MFDREKRVALFAALIDSVLQHAGAFEGHHASAVEHHVFAGSGVSASAFIFLFDAEFAKTADENVLSVFQGFFDDVEKVFNHIRAVLAGKTRP